MAGLATRHIGCALSQRQGYNRDFFDRPAPIQPQVKKRETTDSRMYYTRGLRAQAHKPNLTGFDPKAFAEAAGATQGDPWARAEKWRYTGQFTRWNRFKGSFPGLGIATVAFAAYCGYEYMFLNDDHGHGHGESHGEHH